MITHDIYREVFRPDSDQSHLTWIGKKVTWFLMIPIVWAALEYDGNLIQLLKIKFELLIQCVPAIYLGVHSKTLDARTVIMGLVVGMSVTLILVAFNWNIVNGIHSGIIGLTVNLAICFAGILKNGGTQAS